MQASKTQNIGTRTHGAGMLQLCRTAVKNKNSKFDYAFRRKDDQSREMAGQQGWSPVGELNNDGEKWASPVAAHAIPNKLGGKGEIHLEDTMLMRRPKPASAFYKQMEDTKYNNQIRLINEAAERVASPLRDVGEEITVSDKIGASKSTKFSQRVGVNDEIVERDIFS